MKQTLLVILTLASLVAVSDTWKDTNTGYTWQYRVIDDTVEIYGEYPYDIFSEHAVWPSPTGALAIPASIEGHSVTSIGGGAFLNCSGLTSVTIPNSVTNIGSYAFVGCSGLTSVTIPNGVTSIGDSAFAACSGLTSVTIPDSVTNIGSSAFNGCTGLTSVTLPNSVMSIESYAFYDCSGLNSVTIPGGVTSIGDSAFAACSGLTSVTIPDSVTNIEADAFSGCSGITSVTIPDSVTNICGSAFSGCSGLTSVTINQAVCNSRLSNIFPSAYSTIANVVISASVTNIGSSAFYDCSGLTNVTISDGVTSIGRYAFFGCSGLTSVTIPDSVTSIGSCAFNGCSGLANEDGLVIVRDVVYGYYGDGDKVTIPDSVTNIGEDAFFGCSGLTSVTIPDSVTSIGNQAFYNCSSLVDIKLTDSVTQYGTSCFEGCPAYTLALYRALFGGGNGTAQKNEVALTVTNVVVHYVSTSTQNDWVAPMDAGFVNIVGEVGAGSAVAIAPTWAEKYEGFADRFGTDFTAALTKETGKRDAAGNKMFVWQDYVAGTDPTKEDDVFTASITFDADGKPQIAYSPEFADPDEAAKRKYTTYGKVKLNDQAWTEMPEGEEENYNFFKVKVEMR
ncbi:MAG: leucine-rich repeat domain-containing protein [Kiritimatiellae bacterium]|nr:leucine-rich repeat domain-containing protein [Kiritimatiellia bacterium]